MENMSCSAKWRLELGKWIGLQGLNFLSLPEVFKISTLCADVLRGSIVIFCSNLPPGRRFKNNSRNNTEGSCPNECSMQ